MVLQRGLTMLNMFGTLDPKTKIDWKSQVESLVHAYNCTKHDSSTGFAPYFLMFEGTQELQWIWEGMWNIQEDVLIM